ncbi:hypothetical protein [Neobacillus drentensis]|uniref:hypothetical protein n=1 Tax=Neobacillus drentensis TaxID=220684 RepID=UPI0030008925
MKKKRWDEIFPQVKVTIVAKYKIRRQGMNSNLSSIVPGKVKEKLVGVQYWEVA